MKWPWVSRTAYALALKMCDELQERNDRLVEAVSQATANAPVYMPHAPITVEPPSTWWDVKKPGPLDKLKETVKL